MFKQYFDFKIDFLFATRVTDTSMTVSYVVSAKNPFSALSSARKLLFLEFKNPHVYGFNININIK